MSENKIESHGTDEIVCPYCGYEISDSWEYSDSDDQQCCACDKHFHYNRHTPRIDLKMLILAARSVVEQQANDPGLWFDAKRAPEKYLQQALRHCHSMIEKIYDQQVKDLKNAERKRSNA